MKQHVVARTATASVAGQACVNSSNREHQVPRRKSTPPSSVHAAPATDSDVAPAVVADAAPAAVADLDANAATDLRRQVYELRTLVRAFRATAVAGRLPGTARELRSFIEAIENALSALSGLQLAAINAFDGMVRAEDAAAGVPARDQGRGVARGVQMAVHTTPARASRMVETAKVMATELPLIFDGLCSGKLNSYRAQIVASEARKLPSGARRQLFDKRLASNISHIVKLGPKSLRRRAQDLVDELHPKSAEERFIEEARASCFVEVEDLGHGMSRLTATMPTPHAAYVFTLLDAAASSQPIYMQDRTTGTDVMPRGQAMAQALYERFANGDPIVPVANPEAASERLSSVPLTIDLVISDRALLGYGDEPATILTGGARKNLGSVPASIARALIANGIDAVGGASDDGRPAVWLRKLYANDHGALVATSSRQRFHPRCAGHDDPAA